MCSFIPERRTSLFAVHVVQAEHHIRVRPPVQADCQVALDVAVDVSVGQIELAEARCHFPCAKRFSHRHDPLVLAALLVGVPGFSRKEDVRLPRVNVTPVLGPPPPLVIADISATTDQPRTLGGLDPQERAERHERYGDEIVCEWPGPYVFVESGARALSFKAPGRRHQWGVRPRCPLGPSSWRREAKGAGARNISECEHNVHATDGLVVVEVIGPVVAQLRPQGDVGRELVVGTKGRC
jgi:hypothetical protein